MAIHGSTAKLLGDHTLNSFPSKTAAIKCQCTSQGSSERLDSKVGSKLPWEGDSDIRWKVICAYSIRHSSCSNDCQRDEQGILGATWLFWVSFQSPLIFIFNARDSPGQTDESTLLAHSQSHYLSDIGKLSIPQGRWLASKAHICIDMNLPSCSHF